MAFPSPSAPGTHPKKCDCHAAGSSYGGTDLQEYYKTGPDELHTEFPQVMRDPGTNAGVNVPSQGLWLESQGLSQNNFIPEMAAYGSTSRKRKT